MCAHTHVRVCVCAHTRARARRGRRVRTRPPPCARALCGRRPRVRPPAPPQRRLAAPAASPAAGGGGYGADGLLRQGSFSFQVPAGVGPGMHNPGNLCYINAAVTALLSLAPVRYRAVGKTAYV